MITVLILKNYFNISIEMNNLFTQKLQSIDTPLVDIIILDVLNKKNMPYRMSVHVVTLLTI